MFKSPATAKLACQNSREHCCCVGTPVFSAAHLSTFPIQMKATMRHHRTSVYCAIQRLDSDFFLSSSHAGPFFFSPVLRPLLNASRCRLGVLLFPTFPNTQGFFLQDLFQTVADSLSIHAEVAEACEGDRR